MDSEQLRILRRFEAVKKQLGNALKAEGGKVSGDLEVTEQLRAAGGMKVDGGMKVTGRFSTAGTFSAGNGRLVVPAGSTGALKLIGALEAGGGRLVLPSNSAQDMTLDGEKIWDAGNMAAEDGTWTPVLTGSTGGSCTMDRQAGEYQIIGNTCLLWFRVRMTAKGTVSGNVVISGIPVAGSNTIDANVGSGTCSNVTVSGLVEIIPVIGAASTVVSVWKKTSVSGLISATNMAATELPASGSMDMRGFIAYKI